MELSYCCLLFIVLTIAPGGQAARHDPNEHMSRGHSELPQAFVSSVAWSTDSYSLRRNEPSRLNMHLTVGTLSSSDRISGSGLWEVIVFGSEHPQGSGPRFNQNRNILNRRQASQTLNPGQDMTFDVEFDFMIGQIGCDRVNYFCVEFAKGNRARPDFELPSTTGHNAIRKCQERSCSFPVGGSKRALMTNIGFALAQGDGNAPRGQTNMDITATISTNENSDRIEGTGLWRVGVFGSQSNDGSGRRKNEERNMLSNDDSSRPLIPGSDLVVSGNANLNLQGIGTGQDYPYFCMEFAKGDDPDPDFDLPLSQGSIISCSTIAGTPVDEGRARVRFSRFSSSYEIGREYQDGTVDVTIEARATPRPDSDPLSGSLLWKLGVFGSGNADGTGQRQTVSPQILRPTQSSTTLDPERDLELVATDNLDLRAIGSDTHFPYLCIEFAKYPNSSPDYDMELGSTGSIINCYLLPDRGTEEGHGGSTPDHEGVSPGNHGNHRPRALVSGFGYQLGTNQVPHSHLTEVEITASVTPFENTDTISGRNLWRLGIFGSAESDGHGPRMGEVQQMLPEDERDKTLESGATLTLEGSVNADMRGIGGRDFPYLCVEFGKANPNSNFDFPVNNPSGTLFSCRLYQQQHGGGGDLTADDRPQAVIQNMRTSLGFAQVPGTNLLETTVGAKVTSQRTSDYISEGVNWRLGIYGSKERDGSGPRKKEVTQLLTTDQQIRRTWAPSETMNLRATEQLDLVGIGTGTNYPYLCIEFNKANDNVHFDMPQGGMVACNEFNNPVIDTGHPMPHNSEEEEDRLQVVIAGISTSLGFAQVPGTTQLETTVNVEVRSQSTSDYIPEGVNWRLGIYGSAQDDGSGKRKKEVIQLLSSDQHIRRTWAAGETMHLSVTERLDLSGIGTETNYPYLCIEFDKANNNVNFDLPNGGMVACSLFDNPVPEPEERPEVRVASVTPEKNLKRKEKLPLDVTFDVSVNINPSSDDVSGHNLWVLAIFTSKKKNGRGPRVGEVSQALSSAQQSQTIQNRKKLKFMDISVTLDLAGVKCKDVKYICAEISQGSNQDFELQSSVVGCQKLKCQKKNKKSKTAHALRAPIIGSTLTISSITPSQVSISDDQTYTVSFSAPIVFDTAQSDALTRGINLWKMSVWFNKEASDSKQHALVEQVLESNKKSKYVENPASSFGFGQIELEMDLRGLNCKKLKYFCVKLTPDDPAPPFTLANASPGSNIGCSRSRCR